MKLRALEEYDPFASGESPSRDRAFQSSAARVGDCGSIARLRDIRGFQILLEMLRLVEEMLAFAL